MRIVKHCVGHLVVRLVEELCYEYMPEGTGRLSSDVVRVHHVTRHNTPIHNILSTAPQLSISQKSLGMLPEDGNIMPKHVGSTMRN
jgi:hypothetical protein